MKDYATLFIRSIFTWCYIISKMIVLTYWHSDTGYQKDQFRINCTLDVTKKRNLCRKCCYNGTCELFYGKKRQNIIDVHMPIKIEYFTISLENTDLCLYICLFIVDKKTFCNL